MSNFLIDDDTGLLAAEFVLGTLDSEERANAQSQLRTDHGFIAMVRIWERRFGELHLMVEPVEPDAKVFERIKAKIVEIAPTQPASDGKPAPDGTSAIEATPQPVAAPGAPPGPDTAKPAERPDALPTAEVPKPADASAPVAADTVQPDATAPKPSDEAPASEIAPSGEAGKPPELPRAPDLVVPGPIMPSAVTPTTVTTGAIPPPLPPPSLKLPDKPFDRTQERPIRRAEVTIDVIHSRNRWRLVGVFMTLLVVGLAALLAAWRFIPDRLPARLRPAELMTSLGIQAPPEVAPTVRPPPPEGQFDE
jgi:hypothetical protein